MTEKTAADIRLEMIVLMSLASLLTETNADPDSGPMNFWYV
jgi:hypothetical protein